MMKNIVFCFFWKNTAQRLIFGISAYKITKSHPIIYEQYGTWSPNHGVTDLRSTRILSRRRRDLKGHKLVAATVFMHNGHENYTDLDDYK